jgi:hypothetical protein
MKNVKTKPYLLPVADKKAHSSLNTGTEQRKFNICFAL